MTAPCRRSAAAVAIVTLTLGGCGLHSPTALPVNHYRADPLDVAGVRRVMILPFQEAHGVQAQPEQVRNAFVGELVKLQRFEVAPLPGGAYEHRDLYRSAEHGALSTEALVTIGKRYGIDAVLLGTITGYRPYHPPHLGIRVQMVSLHTGKTVWAAEGLYDSSDAGVIEDLEHYARSQLAEEDSKHDWRINLLSPLRFARYVSYRLVRTWRKSG